MKSYRNRSIFIFPPLCLSTEMSATAQFYVLKPCPRHPTRPDLEFRRLPAVRGRSGERGHRRQPCRGLPQVRQFRQSKNHPREMEQEIQGLRLRQLFGWVRYLSRSLTLCSIMYVNTIGRVGHTMLSVFVMQYKHALQCRVGGNFGHVAKTIGRNEGISPQRSISSKFWAGGLLTV